MVVYVCEPRSPQCVDFTPPFSFKLLSCPAPEPDLGIWDVHTCLVFLSSEAPHQLLLCVKRSSSVIVDVNELTEHFITLAFV